MDRLRFLRAVLADPFVLKADPLLDLRNLRSIDIVFASDRHPDPQELLVHRN